MLMKCQQQLIQIRDRQAIDVYATFDYSEIQLKSQASQTPTQTQKAWVEAQSRLQRRVNDLLDSCVEQLSSYLQTLTAMLRQRASDTVDAATAALPLF